MVLEWVASAPKDSSYTICMYAKYTLLSYIMREVFHISCAASGGAPLITLCHNQAIALSKIEMMGIPIVTRGNIYTQCQKEYESGYG